MDDDPAHGMDLGSRYRLAYTWEREGGYLLGAGASGKVFLMFNALNIAVAVKWLPRGEGINKAVEREVLRHHALPGHPNVIKFLEAFVTSTHLAIVLEYAEGGQLVTHLHCSGGPYSEAQAQFYFRQLTVGVTFLHEYCCHRDIKLQNVMLGQDWNEKEACIKIGDFGFIKSDATDSRAKTQCGTMAFCAPEVLSLGANDKTHYDGKAADVWSCGVCLFAMVTGKLPFTDERNNQAETIKRIIAMDWGADRPAAAHLSDGLLDLLARIFTADPARRPTITELNAHVWMQGTILQDDGEYWHPKLTAIMEPPSQTEEQLKALIEEARQLAVSPPAYFNEEDNRSDPAPTCTPLSAQPSHFFNEEEGRLAALGAEMAMLHRYADY